MLASGSWQSLWELSVLVALCMLETGGGVGGVVGHSVGGVGVNMLVLVSRYDRVEHPSYPDSEILHYPVQPADYPGNILTLLSPPSSLLLLLLLRR